MRNLKAIIMILMLSGCASKNKPMSVATGHKLLSAITTAKKENGCNIKKIESLLAQPHELSLHENNVTKANLYDFHVRNLIKEECFNVAVALVKRHPAASVILTDAHYWEIKTNLDKDLYYDNSFWDEATFMGHKKLSSVVSPLFSKYCTELLATDRCGFLKCDKSRDYERQQCKDAPDDQDIIARYDSKRQQKISERETAMLNQKEHDEEVAAHRAYQASPKAIADKACNALANKKFFQQRIASQRAAASHSGYVDKKVMYESGMHIRGSQKLFEEYGAEYKKLTGKKPNCK